MFSATAFLSFILASSLVSASQLEARKALGAAFTADTAIDVSSIYAAAKSADKKSIASYPTDPGSKKIVDVYADWEDLDGVSAYHFFADMDVDCDGPAYECAGNPDGQSETSFGHLDATKTPYYVLPLSLSEKFKKTIKPNSLGAIICNGNMFFGIFGDQNGDTKEVIGEASLLLAQACFPDDHLSGNNGHDLSDVLYIVFGDSVPDGVSDKTVSLSALKALGDKQVLLLQKALRGSSGYDDNDDDNDKDKDKTPSSSSSTGSNDNKTTTKTTPADSNKNNSGKNGSNSGNSGKNLSSKTTTSQCSRKSRRSRGPGHHSRNKRRSHS